MKPRNRGVLDPPLSRRMTTLIGQRSAPTRWLATTAAARLRRSGNRRADAAEARQIHRHVVAGVEPQGLDEATGQHDLTRAQGLAVGGKMVGEPRQRMVRMAEHVG